MSDNPAAANGTSKIKNTHASVVRSVKVDEVM